MDLIRLSRALPLLRPLLDARGDAFIDALAGMGREPLIEFLVRMGHDDAMTLDDLDLINAVCAELDALNHALDAVNMVLRANNGRR